MDFRKRQWAIPVLLLALGLLSACSARTDGAAPAAAPAAATAPATSAPTASAVATAQPADAPTAAPAAPAVEAAQAAPANWLQTAAVEGDYFVLGNPDAPVRILDYSDFL